MLSSQTKHLLHWWNLGSRYFPSPPEKIDYDLGLPDFYFFLAEIHGIWDDPSEDRRDEKTLVFDRLSRATYMDHMLPEADGYFQRIGLVPYNKRYPGADIPFLTALN